MKDPKEMCARWEAQNNLAPKLPVGEKGIPSVQKNLLSVHRPGSVR